MYPVIFSIFLGYFILILLSKYIDPRVKGGKSLERISIFRIISIAGGKIVIATLPIIYISRLYGFKITEITGFSSFSIRLTDIWKGIFVSLLFVAVNILWNSLVIRIRKHDSVDKERRKTGEIIMSKLPEKLFPLVGIFLLISFEAGLLEEIFFRGIIQTNISLVLSPIFGILITSMLFGIGHFYQGLYGVIETFFLGLLLGFAYYITGSITVPVIGHFLGNFICMILNIPAIIKKDKG